MSILDDNDNSPALELSQSALCVGGVFDSFFFWLVRSESLTDGRGSVSFGGNCDLRGAIKHESLSCLVKPSQRFGARFLDGATAMRFVLALECLGIL